MRRENLDFQTIARSQADIKNQIDELNLKFNSEIKKSISNIKQVKHIETVRSIYKDSDNLSSKKYTKINILDRINFQKLVNLTRYVKIVGKGLIALDIGIRLYKVYQDAKSGKSWERSLAVQSAGFIAATGVTALGFSLVTATVSMGVILTGPLLFLGLATAIGLSYATVKLSGEASKAVEDWTRSGYDHFSKALDDGKRRSFDAISY